MENNTEKIGRLLRLTNKIRKKRKKRSKCWRNTLLKVLMLSKAKLKNCLRKVFHYLSIFPVPKKMVRNSKSNHLRQESWIMSLLLLHRRELVSGLRCSWTNHWVHFRKRSKRTHELSLYRGRRLGLLERSQLHIQDRSDDQVEVCTDCVQVGISRK